MQHKDNLFFALCMALCAMGFTMINLMKGDFFQALFSGVVMLLAAAYVTWFGIARVPPQVGG